MNEFKHTPGPWVWQAEDECLVGPEQVVMRQDEEGRKVFARYPDGTHFANARLIGAAPDLLEALYEAEEYFDNRSDVDYDETGFVPNEEMKLLTVIRAAIAKATGAAK